MQSTKIKQINPHRVQLSNVMDGLDELMGDDIASLMYTDPPWGTGNLRYWETMRLKMDRLAETERRETPKVDYFLEFILNLAKLYVRGLLVVEYGQAWRQMVIEQAKDKGFDLLVAVQTQYKSGSKLLPMDLLLFENQPSGVNIETFKEQLENTHGYDTVTKAFLHLARPGEIVVDPCCGMGYTAQAAVDHKMIFRGNEMNATRLEKTIKRLERG